MQLRCSTAGLRFFTAKSRNYERQAAYSACFSAKSKPRQEIYCIILQIRYTLFSLYNRRAIRPYKQKTQKGIKL